MAGILIIAAIVGLVILEIKVIIPNLRKAGLA